LVSVSDGATLSDAGGLFSGLASGAQSGIAVLSGASLLVGGQFNLAQMAGATATLTVGSSGFVSAPELYVGGAVEGAGGAGFVTIDAGGTVSAADATIYAAGSVALAGGTLLTDPLAIEAGGSLSGFGMVSGAISVGGAITASGGLLSLNGAITGSSTLGSEAGGMLALGGSVAAGIAVIDSGTLTLGDASGFAGTIDGIAPGIAIRLSGVTLGSAAGDAQGVTLGAANVLTVDLEGGSAVTFDLDPNADLTGDRFTLTADLAGGTDIETLVACYAAGTRILTERGETPIELLRVGDHIVTLTGRHRPVVWLGHRTVACRSHPHPRSVFPVRHLVNGTTIVQEQWERVTYWHVELASHDVIVAEGLACETFLDTGNRRAFANPGAAVDLHPAFAGSAAAWRARGCMRLVEDGAVLASVRARLADIAAASGHGAVRLQDVTVARAGILRVDIAPGIGLVRLLSATAHAPGDVRRLGALVTGLRLDGAALADASYGCGFHPAEHHGGRKVRWTDGDAQIAFDAADVVRVLEVDVAGLSGGRGGVAAHRDAA